MTTVGPSDSLDHPFNRLDNVSPDLSDVLSEGWTHIWGSSHLRGPVLLETPIESHTHDFEPEEASFNLEDMVSEESCLDRSEPLGIVLDVFGSSVYDLFDLFDEGWRVLAETAFQLLFTANDDFYRQLSLTPLADFFSVELGPCRPVFPLRQVELYSPRPPTSIGRSHHPIRTLAIGDAVRPDRRLRGLSTVRTSRLLLRRLRFFLDVSPLQSRSHKAHKIREHLVPDDRVELLIIFLFLEV